ncbi:MAG TPA: Gmad2 immunoglobulin-like domain-containing protein [Anaerolineales bacterium]|nr:Gmad2 immunoglobulin-like domain-containing protein [Anaerolineales bacterium]
MVSRRSIIWMLVAILIMSSCRSFASSSPTPDAASDENLPAETSTPAPAYVNAMHNAEYQLGFVDALRIVQLEDGVFEQGVQGSDDFVSVRMTNFTAKGDLNNDGVDEFAALITENYGGDGTFVFLAVFSDVDGGLMSQASVYVDGRPLVDELLIADGEIYLDVTTHKRDDPTCCPTLHSTRHYQLINNQLDMVDYVTFTPDGRPRTITIESPENGSDVFKSVPIKGSVAIAPFENNLVYRIFDVGGVELAIGSLTVNAPDLGGPGTFDENILLGNVLAGAVIRVEVQDVSAEDGSLFAMDSVELVVQ